MIRNIVWDVDGTLFDTYPAIAKSYHLAVTDLGGDVPLDWVMQQARVTVSHCVATLVERCQIDEAELVQKSDRYYEQIPFEEQPPFPGVVEICRYVHSLGGKNLIVTHRGRRSVEDLLAVHNMTGLFSGCITRDDGYPRKPDPAAFASTVKIHQLDLSETINVGDREIDILAGQGAGIFSCLFEQGEVQTAADLLVRSYGELLARLPVLHGIRDRREA